MRFQQPQTAAIGVGAVGALRGIASNPAVRRAIQQGGKAALGGAAAGAGATALADLAGIDTAFSKRKTNGSANGIADKLIDQLESDNPEAMQLLLTMAMGKKGAKVEIPIHGLFTEPIEYEGPDGKILFRSPKGYRLVWTPRGALSVWKPFALKMGFVKNPRKPLVTAGDIGTVRRAASVQKKIRNAAEKAGCVSTPRRRSSSKRKTSGRRRNAQGRFV